MTKTLMLSFVALTALIGCSEDVDSTAGFPGPHGSLPGDNGAGDGSTAPLSIQGAYNVRTGLPVGLVDLAPDDIVTAWELINAIADSPGDAVLVLLREVPGADTIFDLLPSVLERRIAGAIDGAVGDSSLNELVELLQLAEEIVATTTLHSDLSIDGDMATHTLEAVSFGPATITLPQSSLTEAQASVTITGTTVQVGYHSYSLPLGTLAFQALEQQTMERFGRSFDGAVSWLFHCDDIAAAIADVCVFGVCVGHESDFARLCERGAGAVSDRIRSEIAGLGNATVKFQGGTGAISPDGTFAGRWAMKVDFNGGTRTMNPPFVANR